MARIISLVAGESDKALLYEYVRKSSSFRRGPCYSLAQDAICQCEKRQPDIVLVNWQLPDMTGAECILNLKRRNPRILCVVYSEKVDLHSFIRTFQAGADGYLTIPLSSCSFDAFIAGALEGWKPFSLEAQRLVANQLIKSEALIGSVKGLTAAEHRIMSHLVTGAPDKEIAKATGTSPATVHTLTNRVFRKLGVHSRKKAVRVYLGIDMSDSPAIAEFI